VTTLSPSQVFTLLLQGGFPPDKARVMTAIAQAESSLNAGALGDVNLETAQWGPSVGLFQIRTLKAETGTGSDRDIQRLLNNPAEQVKAAMDISNKGNNFGPWSTFKSGAYLQFLNEPLQAGAVLPPGFGTGAGPFGAGPFGAGPFGAGPFGAGPFGGSQFGTAAFAMGQNGVADPFAMTPGVQPSAVTDTDGDGLTDQFERLLGTDLTKADTDGDGLSDAYETTISHTDPLSADTNHDGVTDAVELAQGKDAGHADIPAAARAAGFGGMNTMDSDSDGLSDAYEQKIGTDPLTADTDHDGLSDGAEVARGLNPRALDSNNDGLSDGFAAAHGLLGPTVPGAGLPAGAGVPGGLGVPGGTGLPGALDAAGGLDVPGGSDLPGAEVPGGSALDPHLLP
jgi:Lysozyme like domain/Bacterial TSP3 repeat